MCHVRLLAAAPWRRLPRRPGWKTPVRAVLAAMIDVSLPVHSQAHSLPPDLVATFRHDFGKFDNDCGGPADLLDQFGIDTIHLGRSRRAVVFYGLGSGCFGGNDNGLILLYARFAPGWRGILSAYGNDEPGVCKKPSPPRPVQKGSEQTWTACRGEMDTYIVPNQHRSVPRRPAPGWPDLFVWSKASVSEGTQTVYRFDGHEYKKSPAVAGVF
jgi:hypothetical protein